MNPERILAYLAQHNVLTLATASPEGPWAAAVFYVNDGFDLYFLSSPSSRHGRNLALDPRVAGTIQVDHHRWEDIKGLQLEGRTTTVDAGDARHALDLFEKKFPFTAAAVAAIDIVEALRRATCYRLSPSALYLVDNSIGFGHRECFEPASLQR